MTELSKLDPITGRLISRSCWNGFHGGLGDYCNSRCHCGCHDEQRELSITEAQKAVDAAADALNIAERTLAVAYDTDR